MVNAPSVCVVRCGGGGGDYRVISLLPRARRRHLDARVPRGMKEGETRARDLPLVHVGRGRR